MLRFFHAFFSFPYERRSSLFDTEFVLLRIVMKQSLVKRDSVDNGFGYRSSF